MRRVPDQRYGRTHRADPNAFEYDHPWRTDIYFVAFDHIDSERNFYEFNYAYSITHAYCIGNRGKHPATGVGRWYVSTIRFQLSEHIPSMGFE